MFGSTKLQNIFNYDKIFGRKPPSKHRPARQRRPPGLPRALQGSRKALAIRRQVIYLRPNPAANRPMHKDNRLHTQPHKVAGGEMK